ncbi:hypothetical protein TcYC6_0104350 [Trypanosoma cruzi]|nr:hypothetical protein TcYC6_0104350 [Trypanosoma cruzi]
MAVCTFILLRRRGNAEGCVISLSRLTEEPSTIKFVLSTWAQKDIFFSSLSTPTACLVAVLSDAANNGTWDDEYLCLNARVMKAKKVNDGFQFTGPDSGVSWQVNDWDNNVRHLPLSHDFTLVLLVTIHEAPGGNTPLLTASLEKNNSKLFMKLSYTADMKWVTELKNKITKSSTWEPKKDYQVALTLHGKKVFFCIDGKLLGKEEALLTNETPLGPAHFFFGACG